MSHSSYCYLLVLLPLFFLVNNSVLARRSADIDSLKAKIKLTKADTSKVNLLLEIADNIKCNSDRHPEDYLERAKKLAAKSKYAKGEFEGMFIEAHFYEECNNDYLKAADIYYEAYIYAREQNNHVWQFRALNGVARCYEKRTEYIDALSAYDKILQLDIGNDLKIQIHGNTGVLYQEMGDYTNSLDNYQKAYNLLHEDMVAGQEPAQDDTLTLIALKLQIANIYYSIPDYDRALESYNEVKELNTQIQFSVIDELAVMGQADCYLKMEDYRKAISGYKDVEKGLSDRGDINNGAYLVDAYNRLAQAYYAMSMYDSGLHYSEKALEKAEGTDGNTLLRSKLSATYTTAGKVYAGKKMYPKALRYLKNAIDLSKQSGELDIQSSAWRELSKIYEQMGKATDALSAYHNHIALRDSIYSRKKLQELTRIDMQGYFDRQHFADSMKRVEEKAIAGYKLQRQRILTYSGFGIVLLLLVLSYFVFRNYRREKKANKIISEARDAIKEEKKLSENLLHNILPEEVAQELKERGATTAKHYKEATVMFTDFVNFTKAGERMGSEALVDELHTCFKAFDEIIDKYNIEKIKTIGDAYLAISGVPVTDKEHATNMVNAAKDIQAFMLRHKQELGDRTFEIRIGIHSGDVVAGIVGVKKFAYDIWGDTVNTAARMEQKSEPGKINISHTTYELVKDKFNCTYRGEIEAKNKGKLMMYFVDR